MLEIRPGVIVALVSHDTGGETSLLDEKDVCLIQGTAEPITLETRGAPKAFVASKHVLAAVLQASDLCDGRVRIGASGRAVRIAATGTGPDSIEALRKRVRELRVPSATMARPAAC